MLFKRKSKNKKHKFVTSFTGLLSGFLQGSGLGGSDIRNSYLLGKNLTLPQLHGTTALVGTSTFFLSFVIRLYEKSIVFSDLYLLVLIIPFQYLAVLYGKKVLHKLSDKISNYIILTVMFIAIIGLIVKLITNIF